MRGGWGGFLTQDVLNQDVSCPGGLRVSCSIHGIDLELALLSLLQVRDSDFGRWVELIGWVYPPPIRRALLMNLDDVTFDGASAVSFRRAPGECDAALSFVFNLGGARWAGGV